MAFVDLVISFERRPQCLLIRYGGKFTHLSHDFALAGNNV
jgi:hypothetical protein